LDKPATTGVTVNDYKTRLVTMMIDYDISMGNAIDQDMDGFDLDRYNDEVAVNRYIMINEMDEDTAQIVHDIYTGKIEDQILVRV
jgi:hypothetical protein